MVNLKKNLGLLLVILAILVGVFYGGFLYGKNQIPSIFSIEGLGNKITGQPTDVDFSLFWDAWKELQQKYVDRNSLDKQEMVFGAIEGLVKSLKDPYTVFLKPKEAKIFKDDVSGEFSGIGAEIGMRKDILTVISPLEDSPAQRAGLRAGDKILKINDAVTTDLNLLEAINLIRGPKGTEVKLTINRDDENDLKEITIVRDVIKIPNVKLEIKNERIAHLQLFNFSETAPADFARKVSEILTSRAADRIILDLRNNPGGFLEVAQELAGWFLEPGSLVAIEDFGNGAQNREYRALGNGALKNMPMVILINEGSASASEIMAGALRDNRGIKLIGTKSFGKGSVQELTNLRQASSLKITVAKWLTPSKKSISNEGLEPDIKVELKKEDIDANKDPQLEKANELILQQ